MSPSGGGSKNSLELSLLKIFRHSPTITAISWPPTSISHHGYLELRPFFTAWLFWII